MTRLLILGGTGEAAALATAAQALPGFEVISSLAGRTQHPTQPQGTVRVGGFGGIEGLTAYLQQAQIHLLVDATHPFAAQISWHAAAAAQAVGIPHLRLVRPAWQPHSGDLWFNVATHQDAAAVVRAIAQRVFLTIGRQELAAYAGLGDRWFLMRMIDPPTAHTPIPPGVLVLERGPFTLAAETQLMRQHQIDAVVSKNSGGPATYAKVQAARALQLPVIMVQRPPMPDVSQVGTVEAAMDWLGCWAKLP
ncbi:MAG: cobalt-precorrin-6A reductase [Kaiparowitsia implicata GSE-PSE-MK54-09C]|nr:cobalt-precorrin-6A reductase [Kaiparowitsia implicata GSE-PSE-MK54-09C]